MRAEVFKALGNPLRIQLLQVLQAGDANVDQLVRAIGSSQPAVSRHLAVLRKAGIVTDRRVGINVVYHLDAPRVFRALDIAADILNADARRKRRLLPP